MTALTLAQRLRAAAEAPRLADWVRVSIWLDISLMRSRLIERAGSADNTFTRVWKDLIYVAEFKRKPKQSLLGAGKLLDGGRWAWCLLGLPNRRSKETFPTREAAIRAGLRALAEREEARG